MKQRIEELERRLTAAEEKLEKHEERIGLLEEIRDGMSKMFATIGGIFKSAKNLGEHKNE
jgi:hypothetical protein